MIVVHVYERRGSLMLRKDYNKGLDCVPTENNQSLFEIWDYATKERLDYNCGGSMTYKCQSLPNCTYIPGTGGGKGYLEYIFL